MIRMTGVPNRGRIYMGSMEKRKDRRAGAAGFTLIELLVVVAVIGIISALAVPNLQRAITRSRETATEVEIMKMIESVKLYRADTEDCIPGSNENHFAEWAVENEYFKNPVLTDGWGNEYDIWLYCNQRFGNEYVFIFSGGADGEIWTTDDVVYLYYPPYWDTWYRTGTFD